jgi:hypothetical protein
MLDKNKPMKSLKILDDSNATSFHFLILVFFGLLYLQSQGNDRSFPQFLVTFSTIVIRFHPFSTIVQVP